MKTSQTIVVLLCLVASLAQAETSSSGTRGGGNTANGQLLDFYEGEGVRNFNPTTLPAYRNRLGPLINRVGRLLPNFPNYIREALTSKTWIFDTKVLDDEGCRNGTIYAVETQIVACQNSREVRIYEPWFNATTAINQAGLIMHELLVHHLINGRSTPPSEEAQASLRALNRILFGQLPSAQVLSQQIREHGFARFSTAAELAEMSDEERYMQELEARTEAVIAARPPRETATCEQKLAYVQSVIEAIGAESRSLISMLTMENENDSAFRFLWHSRHGYLTMERDMMMARWQANLTCPRLN